MASKQTERYVRYYTFGSAAEKLEHQQIRPALPKMKPEKKRRPIAVDPVAAFGCAVAFLLAVLMVVGMFRLHNINTQLRQEEIRITALEKEQRMLQERYEEGFDLNEIRAAAASMGMIPAEEAARVQVEVPAAGVEIPRLSWWDSLLANLRQIFA